MIEPNIKRPYLEIVVLNKRIADLKAQLAEAQKDAALQCELGVEQARPELARPAPLYTAQSVTEDRPYLRVRINLGKHRIEMRESEALCKLAIAGESFVVRALLKEAGDKIIAAQEQYEPGSDDEVTA